MKKQLMTMLFALGMALPMVTMAQTPAEKDFEAIQQKVIQLQDDTQKQMKTMRAELQAQIKELKDQMEKLNDVSEKRMDTLYSQMQKQFNEMTESQQKLVEHINSLLKKR